MEPWNFLKAMADETRLRILVVLTENELCVDDLEKILKLSQSNVSRHLAKLLSSGLVSSRRESRHIYYQLNTKLLSSLPAIHNLLKELCIKDEFYPDMNALLAYKKSKIKDSSLGNGALIFCEDDLI